MVVPGEKGEVKIRVTGVAFLHPNFSGEVGPSFARLLGNTKLTRSILRPLLRTEIGEVSNRCAWHSPSLLTPDVIHLYRAPLRIINWDTALLEVCRSKGVSPQEVEGMLRAVDGLPAVVVTGAADHVAPPHVAAGVAGKLPGAALAVLEACGHLSHEEAPAALVGHLAAFCGAALRR